MSDTNFVSVGEPFNWTGNFADLLTRIKDLHERKANDYTGGKDPLENYRRSAEVAHTSIELIMLSRVEEKVTRASNLFSGTKQRVADETVADTMLDIANIALLILNELERKGAESTTVTEIKGLSNVAKAFTAAGTT